MGCAIAFLLFNRDQLVTVGSILFYQVKPKGVTMTVLLAKAAAMALAQHPVVNASCRDGTSFTYNSSINIAVAVSIDGGLITPVLEQADKVRTSDLCL